MFDIARLLESEGIMPGEDFLRAARNLEGFLFPSTYRLSHSTTPVALTQMMTAQGLPTLQRVNIRTDLAELDRLAAEYDVCLILLGLPLHMSGDEGRQAGHAREFAQRLTERTGRQVRLWDERLTTVAAQRVLKSSGISIAKRAKAVDRLSAQILLESFLEMEPLDMEPSA